MPQNTPMKRQFTTIDGRTVMSNLPQHWGGNDWKITGVDNPLPVGNYVQTRSGVWIPQKGSDDGAADVRLTGSNVEEITVINAVALTDTSPIFFNIDTSKYKNIKLLALNTHNAQIEIRVRLRSEAYPTVIWDGNSWSNEPQVVLPNSRLFDLNTFFSFIKNEPINRCILRLQAQSVPTEGSISAYLWGVLK